MSQSRQLAASMFSVIAGYTALMSNEVDHALKVLRKSRSIQQKHVQAFN
jgi:hypothetical protein